MAPMFDVHCPVCGHRELRSIHAIEGIANTPRGIEVTISCTGCQARLRLITGRRVAVGSMTLAAAPTGARRRGDPGPTGPAHSPAA
jgi:hypothetical protein